MKGNRIALIAGVVVIAAVVGFLAVRNYWPPKGGTEGAIGAANRYTAQQISDQDVMLKDPKVQAFLQSDTFHQLATNPDFRSFVEEMVTRSSEARAEIVENLSQTADALQDFQLSENAIAALSESYFSSLPAAQVEALLSKGGLALLSDAGFAQALENRRFRDAAAQGLPEAVEALRRLKLKGGEYSVDRLEAFVTRHPEALTVLGDQRFAQWIRREHSQALLEALNNSPYYSDALASALADMNTRSFLCESSFERLADSKVFIGALKDEGFQKILDSSLDLNKTLSLHD